MNSFHDSVKAKIPAERMPGTAIGKMILTIAPKRVAPSIRAHSSSSLGIVLKYPMRSHVQNGIRNVGYVRISAHGVSPTWKVRMMFASGMKRSVGGTRYVTKIDVPRVPAMGNRSRASAYPARSPQKSEIAVEVTAMNRVFHSQCGKVVFAIRSRKCSSVGCRVQKGVLVAARHERYSSASGRMAVISIQ